MKCHIVNLTPTNENKHSHSRACVMFCPLGCVCVSYGAIFCPLGCVWVSVHFFIIDYSCNMLFEKLLLSNVPSTQKHVARIINYEKVHRHTKRNPMAKKWSHGSNLGKNSPQTLQLTPNFHPGVKICLEHNCHFQRWSHFLAIGLRLCVCALFHN